MNGKINILQKIVLWVCLVLFEFLVFLCIHSYIPLYYVSLWIKLVNAERLGYETEEVNLKKFSNMPIQQNAHIYVLNSHFTLYIISHLSVVVIASSDFQETFSSSSGTDLQSVFLSILCCLSSAAS